MIHDAQKAIMCLGFMTNCCRDWIEVGLGMWMLVFGVFGRVLSNLHMTAADSYNRISIALRRTLHAVSELVRRYEGGTMNARNWLGMARAARVKSSFAEVRFRFHAATKGLSWDMGVASAKSKEPQ